MASQKYGTDVSESKDAETPLQLGNMASPRQKSCDLVAFWLFGLLNNFGYVVFLSAAEKIYSGAAGAVLAADIVPTLIVKATAPLYMARIPYTTRVVVIVALAAAAYITVATASAVWLKLLGVCIGSLAAGAGEITFLALTSRFHPNVVSAWSSGTGAAGVLGSLAYLALTEWIGLSNRDALFSAAPTTLITLVSYFYILDRPKNIDQPPQKVADQETVPLRIEPEGAVEQSDATKTDHIENWPIKRKLQFVKRFLFRPFMVPLFTVYLAEYMINQGVSPAIWFRNAPFSRDSHYVYYQFLYQSGVFISRSSVNILPIRNLDLPPILQFLNFIILLLHALLHFLPNVFLVFLIIFWEGLLGGATYVNAFFQIRDRIDPDKTEFSLGIVSVADSAGITLSSVVSLFLEHALKKHNHWK